LQGTVRLTAAAPAGGFEVSLAPDDTLLTMPAMVRVAEGAASVDFAITTREFDTDTAIPVHVTAAGGGETRVVTVNVLARPLRSLSTVFSFQSPSGDYIGNGQSRSFDTSNANFFGAVSCEYGAIDIWLNQGEYEWNLRFGAPYGTPLRPGTYSNAARQPFQPAGSPGLDVGGEGRGCNRIFGSFTVTDAVYSVSGQIRRFRATFEQRCELPTRPALTGEVSVSDLSSHRNVYVFCPLRSGSLLSAPR